MATHSEDRTFVAVAAGHLESPQLVYVFVDPGSSVRRSVASAI